MNNTTNVVYISSSQNENTIKKEYFLKMNIRLIIRKEYFKVTTINELISHEIIP